ncbi:hypothetical protein AUEXF2481DRAFT_422253 [Aureobasidium subglaciale EXF-2481]|uniref:Uncharacterized protein n=1 Tax=Aureobasidium subglaciale (strain EXF-2481) TaxID=1043005 RepID=A0A074Y978_AURSE|nr:uncharacterized protein AUEXF2481DRAFT_422253 [Aureobasidium subglaciale EXF-2481]KEQ92534.1 hypothetical protein AUEXF2481DRAFT_422253 [Aureobasidium subglaciale EXF-2481]
MMDQGVDGVRDLCPAVAHHFLSTSPNIFDIVAELNKFALLQGKDTTCQLSLQLYASFRASPAHMISARENTWLALLGYAEISWRSGDLRIVTAMVIAYPLQSCLSPSLGIALEGHPLITLFSMLLFLRNKLGDVTDGLILLRGQLLALIVVSRSLSCGHSHVISYWSTESNSRG